MMKKVMMVALVVLVALVAVEAVNMRKISSHKKALIQVEHDGVPTRAWGKSLVTGFCALSDFNEAWCDEIHRMNRACHDDGADRNECIALYESVQATFIAWCKEEEHKEKCKLLYNAWDTPVFRLPDPTYSSTGHFGF